MYQFLHSHVPLDIDRPGRFWQSTFTAKQGKNDIKDIYEKKLIETTAADATCTIGFALSNGQNRKDSAITSTPQAYQSKQTGAALPQQKPCKFGNIIYVSSNCLCSQKTIPTDICQPGDHASKSYTFTSRKTTRVRQALRHTYIYRNKSSRRHLHNRLRSGQMSNRKDSPITIMPQA